LERLVAQSRERILRKAKPLDAAPNLRRQGRGNTRAFIVRKDVRLIDVQEVKNSLEIIGGGRGRKVVAERDGRIACAAQVWGDDGVVLGEDRTNNVPSMLPMYLKRQNLRPGEKEKGGEKKEGKKEINHWKITIRWTHGMLRKAMHQHQRRTRSIVTKMNADVWQSNPQMWPVVKGANLRQRRENEQCPKSQNMQQIHPVRALDGR
jgi:hypothetical protein